MLVFLRPPMSIFFPSMRMPLEFISRFEELRPKTTESSFFDIGQFSTMSTSVDGNKIFPSKSHNLIFFILAPLCGDISVTWYKIAGAQWNKLVLLFFIYVGQQHWFIAWDQITTSLLLNAVSIHFAFGFLRERSQSHSKYPLIPLRIIGIFWANEAKSQRPGEIFHNLII